jgi:hypothetical protein
MNQALKVKELDNASVYTYVVGITNKIDINATTMNKKLAVDPIVLQHFAYSMLWIAASHRQDASQGCRVIYEYLKKHDARGGNWENFKLGFAETWHTFKTWLMGTRAAHPTNLSSFDVQPIAGYYIDLTVEVLQQRISSITANNTRAQAGRLRKQANSQVFGDFDRRHPPQGVVYSAPDTSLAFALAMQENSDLPAPVAATIPVPSAPIQTITPVQTITPSAPAVDINNHRFRVIVSKICDCCGDNYTDEHCCLRLKSCPLNTGFEDGSNCQKCGIVVYPFTKHNCVDLEIHLCSIDPDVEPDVSSGILQDVVLHQHRGFVTLYRTNALHRLCVCPICFVMYRTESGEVCRSHDEHLQYIIANGNDTPDFDIVEFKRRRDALPPPKPSAPIAGSLNARFTELDITAPLPTPVVLDNATETSSIRVGFSKRLNLSTNKEIRAAEGLFMLTVKCPICTEQIPDDEYPNHVSNCSNVTADPPRKWWESAEPNVTSQLDDIVDTVHAIVNDTSGLEKSPDVSEAAGVSKFSGPGVIIPRSDIIMQPRGGKFIASKYDGTKYNLHPQLYEFPFDPSFDELLGKMPQDEFKKRAAELPSYRYCGLNAARTKLQQIFSFFGIKKYGTVYDLGCGPGSAGAVLREHARKVVGFYYSGKGGEVKDCYKQDYDSLFPFDATIAFPDVHDANLVYCDIGPQDIARKLFTKQIDHFSKYHRNTLFVLKMYVPNSIDYKYQREFMSFIMDICRTHNTYAFYKPPASHELNNEIYFLFSSSSKICELHNDTIENLQNTMWLFENRRLFAVRRFVQFPHTDRYVPDAPELELIDSTVDLRPGEIKSYISDLSNLSLGDGLNVVCAQAVKRKFDATSYKCKRLTGAPGCGKTTFYRDYIKNHCHDDCIVVCSTDDLRTELRNDLKSLKVPVYTQHNVYKHQGVVRTIFVDEFFTFPVAAPLFYANVIGQPNVEVVLVGDPNQIPDLFSELYPDSRRFTDIFPDLINNFTRRSANDVTDLLGRLGYGDIQTTSNVTSSISVLNTNPDNCRQIIRKLNWPVISFNRSSAGNMSFANSKTVHGSQGHTFPNVILYVDPKAMSVGMSKSIRHVRVALSRHTENILILGSADGLLHDAFHENSPLQVNGSRFGQERSEVYEHDLSLPDKYWTLHSELLQLDDVSIAEALQVLDDMIPTNMANIDEFAAIQRIVIANKGRRTCGS